MNAKCLANTLNGGLAGRGGNDYPLRRLARAFAVVGAAVVTYAAALVLIAVEAAIVEF